MARVLVIDDDPQILALVAQSLRLKGHQVFASTDPDDTVPLARDNAVDAVVLDVMMPYTDGYEALRSLRSHAETGGIPVLFLSAYSESETRIRGLREGADDFLAKPFAVEELLLRIERLIAPQIRAAPQREPVLSSALKRSLDRRQVVGHVYLGRYQALEVVGEGAMGLVFRGWDPRLKRPVALKTLRLDRILSDADRRRRATQLLREAISLARFSHPNIVAIYDVEPNPELAFMAMEYVDGHSLATWLDNHTRMNPAQTVRIALGIARGLAAAHEHSLVHHDVKPGNVLLGPEDMIKVTDFGVAHLVSSLVDPQGKVFGTAGYLPPEALLGRGYDERGDLFAMGAVIYECLTGSQAFGGSTLKERVRRTVKTDIKPVLEEAPDAPPALVDLIDRLLRKAAEQRPSTAQEVVAELEQIATGQPEATVEVDKDEFTEARGSAGLHSTIMSRTLFED